MNRSLYAVLSFLFALPVLTLGLMNFHSKSIDDAGNKEKTEAIAAYQSWMTTRMADPATGKIPANALWKAYQQLVNDGRIRFDNKFVFNRTRGTMGWQPINDFFPSLSITTICYDPTNTKTFYFCTGESYYGADEVKGAGIFKSTDGGNTWSQLTSTKTDTFAHCIKMLVQPVTGYVYVATRDGLWRSKDGGSTWKQVLGQNGDRFSDLAITKNGTLFAALGVFQAGAAWRSSTGDSGTWVAMGSGFPSSGSIYFVTLAPSPSKDSVIYVGTCNSANDRVGGFYRSDNMGKTWHSLNIPGSVDTFARVQAWYDLVLKVDPNNDSIVYAAGLDMWRSRDAGNTWFRLSQGDFFHIHSPYVHVDHHCALFDGSKKLTVGCDGGIYRATNFTDSLPHFYSKNYGYRVTQYYDAAVDPRAGNPYIVGGTQDNGSPAILNPGLSNYRSESWGDGTYAAINYNNPDIRYTTRELNGQYRLNYSKKGIDTITNPYVTDANLLFVNPLVMDPNNPERLFMASSGGLYRLDSASKAKKTDWKPCTRRTGVISAIGVSTNVPNIVYLGRTDGKLFKVIGSDTSGKLYKPIAINNNLSVAGNCQQMWVDPANVNHVFAIFSNYGIQNIWETWGAKDSTKPVWVNHDGDLPDMPVYGVFAHPTQKGVCYIATELGVFYTAALNGSSTHWIPANTGLANVRVEEIKYRSSDSTIYAITHGRGIYQSKINLSNTGSYLPQWNERGPVNVGGRTLTLMIDPNDTTHQTMWAGSASGGLWRISSIDSLNDQALRTHDISVNPVAIDALIYPNPFVNSFTIQTSYENRCRVEVYDATGHVVVEDVFQKQYTLPGNTKLAAGIYYVSITEGSKKIVKKVLCTK